MYKLPVDMSVCLGTHAMDLRLTHMLAQKFVANKKILAYFKEFMSGFHMCVPFPS